MKKLSLFALVATMFVACATDATQDLAPEIPTAPDELYVSFDEEDTRIQLKNGAPVWNDGDLVSVFYRSNAHDKYEFTGETGDTNGTLRCVKRGTPTIGLDKVVAVYPYNENYRIEFLTGNIQAFLPAEQTYAEDSYGIGSSIMISSSRTDRVYLKNVCGWLKLQFTGADTTIKKIVLRGNNGEQLAGNIYITADDASCTLASDLTGADGVNSGDLEGTLVGTNTIITSVTLNCGDGIALNSETPTAFYIALPPQTFKKGFTVTAICDDGTMRSKSTENSLTIERNHIAPMASLAVETLEITDAPETPDTPTQPTPPANEIWYTTTDGKKLLLDCTPSDFGAILISDKYENGQGILTFDDKVTKISTVFRENAYLKSITIPNSVTEIGNNAFRDCSALTSVTIGNSVTTIGDYAFYNCDALTSITIPDSVTTIRAYAFEYCSSLTSVTIPDSVTTIGRYAFEDCSSLTSVHITDVAAWCKISFGDFYANPLSYAGNLYLNGELVKDLVIPDSVTEIGNYAFYGCSKLTSITIPDSVTTIGWGAFNLCTSLTSVTIPDSVTEIESFAFHSCYSLKEVYCKPTTPPGLSGSSVFDNNASSRKIYVPAASVSAYKSATNWREYASAIYAYEF